MVAYYMKAEKRPEVVDMRVFRCGNGFIFRIGPDSELTTQREAITSGLVAELGTSLYEDTKKVFSRVEELASLRGAP